MAETRGITLTGENWLKLLTRIPDSEPPRSCLMNDIIKGWGEV